jgi:drug/metabolite transporter (DMT)-like permease
MASDAAPRSSLQSGPMVFALVALLSLGWGFSWPLMKIALTEFPLWTFRAISCLSAGLCLLGLARLTGGPMTPVPSEWRGLALAALCNVTAWHMLVGYGVVLVASGHAAVLAYTMPLWVVVLGTVFLGQPLEAPSIAGLILGLAGIVTLVAPDLETLRESPLGAGFILLGAMCWAVGTLIQKHLTTTRLSTMALTGWQLVIGSIPILLLAPIIEGLAFPQVSGRAWAAGVYITIVALVVCYFLWFKIVSLLPASRASISMLLVPALGVISGALFLDEAFGWREVLALAFIASALIMVLVIPAARRARES